MAVSDAAVRPQPTVRTLALSALAMVFVQSSFGGYSLITSAAFKSCTIAPIVYALLRDIAATILLMVAAWLWCKKFSPRAGQERFWPLPEHQGIFALAGLFAVFGSQGLSALSVKALGPTLFSLLEPLMPLVSAVGAMLMGQERFVLTSRACWAKVVGVLLSVSGAIIIPAWSSGGGLSNSPNPGLGFLYIVFQLGLGGSYPVAIKTVQHGYPSIVATAWMYFTGTLLLACCVLTGATEPADWDISPMAVGAIAYSAVIASALNYFLMVLVNGATSPLFVMLFSPVQGVVSALLGYLVNGTPVSAGEGIGGAIIAAGLFLAIAGRSREEAEAARERKAQHGSSKAPGGAGTGGRSLREVQDVEAGGGDGAEDEDDVLTPLVGTPRLSELPALQHGSRPR